MNARSQRSRLRTTVIVVGSAAAFVFGSLGVWARVRTGPLWPTLLTDWSLGAALFTASSTAVGATVASRLPRNPVGWLFLAMGVLTGAVFGLRGYATLALAATPPGAGAVLAAWGFAWAIPINMTCLALLLLLFPHGTPPSGRWRPVAALIVAVGGATTVATLLSPYFAGQTPFASLPNPTAVLPVGVGTAVVDWTSTFMLLVQALAVLGLVLRARHSHGAERQQVKWFVFAAVVVVFTFLPGYWFEPLFVVATLVALPALPVAAGIGVLRYRLYDIDRIVSRTVAYAVLTVLLVGIYLAAVTTLTALTSPVTGDAPVAVAAATLLAAAAFQPARRRIQAAVDQRFNRARYDGRRTVEAFATSLRQEVDLDDVRMRLVGTVGAVLQPTDVRIWLKAGTADS